MTEIMSGWPKSYRKNKGVGIAEETPEEGSRCVARPATRQEEELTLRRVMTGTKGPPGLPPITAEMGRKGMTTKTVALTAREVPKESGRERRREEEREKEKSSYIKPTISGLETRRGGRIGQGLGSKRRERQTSLP